MYTKSDWSISISEEQYLAAQPESFAHLLSNPNLLTAFREALTEVRGVVEPRACWDRFPITGIRHDRLLLGDGTKIGGGPVVAVVAGAEELVVAVCTIGDGADRLMDTAQKAKQFFRAMVLHEMTSWMVGLLRQELCQHLERTFRQEGLRVSASLSPGESVWSVKDQAVIFSLLDPGKIGVTLNQAMVMSPSRSVSLIMGVGKQPIGVEGASNCDFCTMKDRCQYRHRVAVQLPEAVGIGD